MKQIAIGTDDFRMIREGKFLYVDKSLFIREVLNVQEVLLLPRPRRFGKTLNMTMLQAFFDQNQDSRALFEGLAISADPDAMSHLNAYPTVFISFKKMSAKNWTECCDGIVELVADTLARHYPDLDLSKLSPSQRDHFQAAYDQKAAVHMLSSILKTLTELLYLSTGKKAVLLIDEYDTPIHEGHAQGYYPQIIHFMRGFLGEALKGNPYLERAVITGILRISKESIYSGLNNLSVYSIQDPEFATCFGFTEDEVHQILCDTDLTDKEAGIKAWYNGYRFGEGTIIYNPWSILMYVKRAPKRLRPFWINTSSNHLIRELLQNEAVMSLADLEILLSGGTVRKNLQENITFTDLNSDGAWSLMLFTGYLTARNIDEDEIADLAIPNLEVQRFFRQTVATWLGGESAVRKLADHLLAEDLVRFASDLAAAVKSILSYHDTAAQYPERAYHVFLLGLLAHLQDRFRVESNREAGHGRADLCLIPRKPGKTGFILELKASPSRKTLEADAQSALTQIEEQDYLSQLREGETSRSVAIGLAFHGKRIALASQTYDATNKKQGPRQTHSAGELEPAKPEMPNETDQLRKAVLAGQIQMIQKLKGQDPLPTEALLTIDLTILESMVKTLQN